MTIKEIASIAGVSQSTVSLALNNKGAVKEETRKQILEIANEYGYSINKKSTEIRKNIILIKYINSGIAINQNGDFVARLIDSIEATASNYNYNILIKNIMAADWANEIKNIIFEDFIGALVIATEAEQNIAFPLVDVPIPVVTIDNMFENVGIDSVVMDNYGGIQKAIYYLYQMGHKKIGYIGSEIRFNNTVQRAKAYRAVMDEMRIPYEESWIKEVMPTLEGAYQNMLQHLIHRSNMPTAYITANDTIAIGTVKALKEVGIRVPEEVSIIGFDDIPFCMMLDHTLTTMRVNKEKLGEAAVKLLVEKINLPTDESIKLLVQPKLIERESVQSKRDY